MRNTILGYLSIIGLALGPAMTASTTAQAQEGSQAYGYLGGGVGYYRLDNESFPEDFPEDPDNFKDEREAYKVFIGGMANPYFGVEAGYTDLAEASDGGFEVDTDGATLALLGQIPLGNVLSFYGKGGMLFWDSEVRGPLGFRASNDGNDPFYGVGARIGVSTPLGLRLEYERFEIEDTDVDLASVNLEFRF